MDKLDPLAWHAFVNEVAYLGLNVVVSGVGLWVLEVVELSHRVAGGLCVGIVP